MEMCRRTGLAFLILVSGCSVDERSLDVYRAPSEIPPPSQASSGDRLSNAAGAEAEPSPEQGGSEVLPLQPGTGASDGGGSAPDSGDPAPDSGDPAPDSPGPGPAPAESQTAESPPMQPPAMPAAPLESVLQIRFAGDGFGRIVVSAPDASVQSCERDCQVIVPAGAHVSLEASALPTSSFVAWSGGPCSGAVCSIDLDSGLELQVQFQLAYNVAFASEREYSVAELPRPGAAANQECARLAAAAGLHGTRWVAWLAANGSTTAAADDITPAGLLQNPGGWVRTDGAPFARSREALLAGEVLNPLNLSERRTSVATLSWSGTSPDGSLWHVNGEPMDCNNWTSLSGSDFGGTSVSSAVGFNWAGENAWYCDQTAALQCFGDDAAPAVPLPARDPARRIMFLSSSSFAPGGGISAADQLCQRDACNAGLTGSNNCAVDLGSQRRFLSYLHSSRQPGWARFDLNGAGWVRADGIEWLPLAADLAGDAARHLTGEDVHADGSFNKGFNVFWVGDPAGTDNCNDWTSSAGQGCYGDFLNIGNELHRPPCSRDSCAEAYPVLCLQQ